LEPINVLQSATHVARKEGDDDTPLVLRAIDGDHDAFETLVERHRGVVRRVARRLTSEEDADDIMQRAFLKAFISLSSFRFKASFRTWLVSIALNEARMCSRRSRRQREFPLSSAGADEDAITDFPDLDAGPEARYSDTEMKQLLYSEIDRLRPQEQAAIRSCDLEELSLAEAAILFGTTISALKSRRSRGRAHLRQKLLRRLSPTVPERPQNQQVESALKKLQPLVFVSG
jgi:RNA polymerase sigma factor (sigma-70 family)